MSAQTIIILIAIAIVAVIALGLGRRSGPRVTHIDRTVRKEKGSDDA